jgi:hypothetical protein
MINSTQGSPDGMRVVIYQKGYEYDLPDKLATAFVEIGAGDYIIPVRQRKSIQAAPENAAINAAPENANIRASEAKKPSVEEVDDKQVIRVYQLAETLDVPSKEIIAAARRVGIYARAPASGISKDEVDRIKKALKKKRK